MGYTIVIVTAQRIIFADHFRQGIRWACLVVVSLPVLL